LIGCSKSDNLSDIPTVSNGAQVINPKVAVSDTTNYQIESACVGITELSNNKIQGIIKVKYMGSTDIRNVTAYLTFMNKDNVALYKSSVNISNVTCCYCRDVGSNVTSFFTVKYKVGYIFIEGTLTEYGLSALEDISGIEMSVEATPFTYQAPVGKFTKTGNPYKDIENNWYVNVINDGDLKISLPIVNIKFLYMDSENKLYRWSYPDNYELENIIGGYYYYYDFSVGETARFKVNNYNFYGLKKPFTCVDVCVQWYSY
jgi:hypothetical protein